MPLRYGYRLLLLLFVFLVVVAGTTRAQELDGRLTTPPSPAIKQHWPGVFVRGGRLYVRWGEARPSADTNIKVDEIWYVLGEWARRGDNGGDVVAATLPEQLKADPGAVKSLVSVVTRTDPGEFDGANVGGSMQWRGDIIAGGTGNDSIYKARFDVYMPSGNSLKRVTLYNESKRQVLTLRLRTFGYNPATGEVLAAWVNNVDANGFVTCVDTAGVVKWSFGTIPLPRGLYHLIPVRDREFIVVQDSFAIRYRDGNPVDTTMFAMEPLQRFRRLGNDRFLRMYLGADTAHYAVELYSTDGQLIAQQQVFRPNAQSTYFVAENFEDNGIGMLMAGPDGVYATVLSKDLVERMPLRRVSRGADSAFSVSGAFAGDTLYAAWQDNRDTVPRIYARAMATGTFSFGVDDPAVTGRLQVRAVAPNPANDVALIDVATPSRAPLMLELYDGSGRKVLVRPIAVLEAGRHTIPLDVQGLASGSYRIVATSGAASSSSPLIVVH